MQYKVPQNVDIEDKVIGPLTIRQFIIILIAVGIILVLNFILIGPLRMIFFLAAFLIGGLAVLVAFVKYGDQNFEVFLLSAWKTFVSPRKRIWKKETPKEAKQKQVKPKPEPPKTTPKKNIEDAREDLSRLAEIVDSGGYSQSVNESHSTNISEKKQADTTPDLLAHAERANKSIDPLIDNAQKVTPKREQLVSEAASVDPGKTQETPKIKLRGEEFK